MPICRLQRRNDFNLAAVSTLMEEVVYQFTISSNDRPSSRDTIHPTDGCGRRKQPRNSDRRRSSSERANQEFRYHCQSLMCTVQARNFCEIEILRTCFLNFMMGLTIYQRRINLGCEPTQKKQHVTNKYSDKAMYHPY